LFEAISDIREKTKELLNECALYARSHKMDETAHLLMQGGEQCAEERYQIAIIGFMKRGKSTLLNVLLGREDTLLAPVKSTICTSAITKYLDSSLIPDMTGKAVVHFMNGDLREIPHTDLDDFINQKKNHDNEKGVKFIEVYGVFPLIRSSVAIVDTPGRGSIHREHDIISDEFLPHADAIILVQAADLPMDADERLFLSNLRDKEKRRIFVVVTKSDIVSEKDLTESVDFIRSQLLEIGIPCNKIYRTAAQKVLEAHKAGEDARVVSQLRSQWGIKELEYDIQDIILRNSERTEWIKRRFSEALSIVEGFLSSETKKAEDALARFSGDVQELESEQKRVITIRKEFQHEYQKKREVFIRNWRYEVRRFIREMESVKQRVGDRLQRDLENKGLIGLWSHSTKLPRYVKEMLASEFQGSLLDLEKHLNALLEEFRDVFEDIVETSLPYTRSNITGFSSGMVASLGLAGTSIVLGAGAAMSTVGSVTAAVSGTAAAAASAAESTAFWSSWFGTQTAANAAASAAAFKGVLFGTTATALGTLFGIGFGVLLTTKIATSWARGAQAEKIIKMLDTQFDDFGKALGDRLEASCNDIADVLLAQANEQVKAYEVQLEAIAQALRDNDPSIKEGIMQDKKYLQQLSARYVQIKNSLSGIGVL